MASPTGQNWKRWKLAWRQRTLLQLSCKNLALYITDCVSLCLSDETLKTVGPFYLASSICVKVVVELQILECGRARDVHSSTVGINTVSQPRLWWTTNNGPLPLLPATGWALLPGRSHHHHREGNGMCPDVATPCVKDTREEKIWCLCQGK